MGQDSQVGEGEDPRLKVGESPYDRLQAQDSAEEVRIGWSELAVIAVLVLVAAGVFIVR